MKVSLKENIESMATEMSQKIFTKQQISFKKVLEAYRAFFNVCPLLKKKFNGGDHILRKGPIHCRILIILPNGIDIRVLLQKIFNDFVLAVFRRPMQWSPTVSIASFDTYSTIDQLF